MLALLPISVSTTMSQAAVAAGLVYTQVVPAELWTVFKIVLYILAALTLANFLWKFIKKDQASG